MIFEILVTVDGVVKFFEIVSDTAENALNDVREAFVGEVVLLQYKTR
ncbi:hypothetical protein [Bradyrhizobium liaoningense]